MIRDEDTYSDDGSSDPDDADISVTAEFPAEGPILDQDEYYRELRQRLTDALESMADLTQAKEKIFGTRGPNFFRDQIKPVYIEHLTRTAQVGITDERVLLFRGIAYLKDRWSASSRRAHRRDLRPKEMYSDAVLRLHSIPYREDAEFLQDYVSFSRILDSDGHNVALSASAEVLRTSLLLLRASAPIIVRKHGLGVAKGEYRIYSNRLEYMQGLYSNGIDRFLSFIEMTKAFPNLLRLPSGNPFISASELPLHALEYAFGSKSPYRAAALDPRYDSQGKPRKPYSGILYVTRHMICDFQGHTKPNIVREMSRMRSITPSPVIGPELEVSFLASIPRDRIVHCQKVKFPKFDKAYWPPHYLRKYCIDSSTYLRIRAIYTQTGVAVREEKLLVTEYLREYLSMYYSLRLMSWQIREARDYRIVFLTPSGSVPEWDKAHGRTHEFIWQKEAERLWGDRERGELFYDVGRNVYEKSAMSIGTFDVGDISITSLREAIKEWQRMEFGGSIPTTAELKLLRRGRLDEQFNTWIERPRVVSETLANLINSLGTRILTVSLQPLAHAPAGMTFIDIYQMIREIEAYHRFFILHHNGHYVAMIVTATDRHITLRIVDGLRTDMCQIKAKLNQALQTAHWGRYEIMHPHIRPELYISLNIQIAVGIHISPYIALAVLMWHLRASPIFDIERTRVTIMHRARAMLAHHALDIPAAAARLPALRVGFCSIYFNNPILNRPHLLQRAHFIGGAKLVNSLITLGQDKAIAKEFLKQCQEYGIDQVLHLCMGQDPDATAIMIEPAVAREPVTTIDAAGVVHHDLVPAPMRAFIESTSEFYRTLELATPEQRVRILSQALNELRGGSPVVHEVTARTYKIAPPAGTKPSNEKAITVYTYEGGKVLASELVDGPIANVSVATPVLYLDTHVRMFNAFVRLVNKGTESVGDLVYRAGEVLNKILDSLPEGSKKTILTMLLLDTVDILHSDAQMLMPFAPGGGGPDDEPGYGGGGDEAGDKLPGGFPSVAVAGGNSTFEEMTRYEEASR